MDGARNTSFAWIQTAMQGCAVTSLVSALSLRSTRSVPVCAVSRSVIHGALRSQTIPQPTRLVSHVLQATSARNEWNLSGTTRLRNRLHVGKGYHVATM